MTDPSASTRISRFLAALRPEPATWSAATRATFWGTLGLCMVSVIINLSTGTWRNPANFLALVYAPFLLALLVGGMVLLVRWLGRMPAIWLWTFLTAAMLLAFVLSVSPLTFLGAMCIPIMLSLLGGGWSAVRSTTGRWRVAASVWLLLGAGALAGVAGVLIWDGPAEQPIPNAAAGPSPLVPPLALPDPAERGPYEVKTLTYGSGMDRHRPEFGAQVSLRTEPFDGSPLLPDWKGWARTRFWGFDAKRLPIQGRVYYPDGPGPFPLVLTVHGGHEMEDFSDPGYGYLGELLASRGIVFVSVDENFLNISLSDFLSVPDFLLDDLAVRSVLLLEHLRTWRGFNQDPAGLFYGKVDLERVALIGHSRGGEAVTLAASFNRLPYYPDDARVKFDYGFGLRAVVGLAPVNGNFKPGKEDTPLTGVSYLALHGSHDGDVQEFEGLRQWSRVRLDSDAFRIKAAVYVHGANHCQFNTVWGQGRHDDGGLRSRIHNLTPIRSPEDQRRVAQVYVSAFLEATLRDRWDYLPLFRDSRAGGAWLPAGIYLSRVATSADQVLCSYQEDLDLTSTTMPGGAISAANLTDWREQLVMLKWGDQATRAVFLGWNGKESPGAPPQYEIRFPDSVVTSATTQLVFDLADAKMEPSPRDPDREPSAAEAEQANPRQPIDLTLEVVDDDGRAAQLPLSAVRALQPQLEARVIKLGFLDYDPNSDVVFQSYGFPLGTFQGIDPTKARVVRFRFDRTPKGVVVLDQVALRDEAR